MFKKLKNGIVLSCLCSLMSTSLFGDAVSAEMPETFESQCDIHSRVPAETEICQDNKKTDSLKQSVDLYTRNTYCVRPITSNPRCGITKRTHSNIKELVRGEKRCRINGVEVKNGTFFIQEEWGNVCFYVCDGVIKIIN